MESQLLTTAFVPLGLGLAASTSTASPLNDYGKPADFRTRQERRHPSGSSLRFGKRKANAQKVSNAKYKASRKASRANRARMSK
jgi:hypothetical protein